MDQQKQWLTKPGGLADRLGELQDAAQLNGKDLAERLGWDPTKVSRVRNGRIKPSPSDVVAWAEAVAAGPDVAKELLALLEEIERSRRDWRLKMSRGQVAVQAAHNDWAARSSVIRYFDTAYIPGWLQTREYVRRVLDEMVTLHGLKIDDVDAAVTKRLQRQQMLYDTSKRFELLVAEPVLRYLLVSPQLMRAQLDRLQTVVDLDNVRFGIVPMGVRLATTPQNSFQIYDDYVVVETFAGEDEPDDEAVTAKYMRAMDLMWEEAATGSDARRLIVAAADALPS